MHLSVRPEQSVPGSDVHGDGVVRFKFAACCSTISMGAFATHLAMMSGWTLPSLTGRSRKSGGFFGLGDHAAADPRSTDAPNPGARAASSACARVLIASAADIHSRFGLRFAVRQHALIMYKLANTSGRFIPIRSAP